MYGEGSLNIASRTRGALLAPKKKPDEHPNLIWKNLDRVERKILNNKLNRLSEREIDVPRIISWRIMKQLGCNEFLEDMLLMRVVYGHRIVTSEMWKRALEIREPIHMEWCLEFF